MTHHWIKKLKRGNGHLNPNLLINVFLYAINLESVDGIIIHYYLKSPT